AKAEQVKELAFPPRTHLDGRYRRDPARRAKLMDLRRSPGRIMVCHRDERKTLGRDMVEQFCWIPPAVAERRMQLQVNGGVEVDGQPRRICVHVLHLLSKSACTVTELIDFGTRHRGGRRRRRHHAT